MSAMDQAAGKDEVPPVIKPATARKRPRAAQVQAVATQNGLASSQEADAGVKPDNELGRPDPHLPSPHHRWLGRLLEDSVERGREPSAEPASFHSPRRVADADSRDDVRYLVDATTTTPTPSLVIDAPPPASAAALHTRGPLQPDGRPEIAVPGLRRYAPSPVIPWHTRAQRHLKELTQPGRIESETDGVIAGLLSRPALTDGCKTVAVLGAKGGAGKSTTSLALGLLLGTFDAAKPVVMEVNPDLGNVRQLLPEPNPRTVQDLLEGLVAAERGGVNRVQGYLTMWGRLGVLTAPQRPDEMARLSPRDYARALRLLKLYFGTVILDCGTSFTNRLQQWAIQTADHLVLVTQPEEAPLLTTLAAIDYLASTAYAEDYRGVFREVADAAGPEWTGARGSRGRRDMTLVVNGVGFAGRRDPVDPDKIRAAATGLNAVIDVPYSAELRRRINDGVLTPEALPTPYRRAIKGGLAAVLGRLAEG